MGPANVINKMKDNNWDKKNNVTRFILVTKTLEVAGFHIKCSIVCSPKINQYKKPRDLGKLVWETPIQLTLITITIL